MIRHNKSGFTLVELLAVVVILAIILAIAVPSISNVLDSSKKSAMESDAKLLLKTIDLKKLETADFNPLDYNENLEGLLSVLKLNPDNYESIAFTINNGKLLITIEGKGKWEGLTACGSYHNMKVSEDGCELDFVPPVITLIGDNPLGQELGVSYEDPGTNVSDNSGESIEVNIDTDALNVNQVGKYTITYTATDSSGNTTMKTRTVIVASQFSATEGVNRPKLALGMTAIKWNGTTEQTVANPNTDTSWYDYANQEWANAKTADGSYWVWIPRYAYQITKCYHQDELTCANPIVNNQAGEVDIKFLIDDTNQTIDSTIIYEDNATDTHHVLHPAFTFGDKELTGIWVAKFEMSGEEATLASKPNVAARISLTVGTMFTWTRNMEKNANYGWTPIPAGVTLGSNGIFSTESGATPSYNGVDTHMIKNIEWGAVAYLSQSQYGKYGNNMYTGANKEIYQNKSSTYITGRSSGLPGGSGSDSCAYNVITNREDGTGSCGGGASTTGNIYGIYDMSGGTYEYAMGNYNYEEGDSGIADVSLIDDKYIDIYTAYNNTKYGDAVYETSSSGSEGYNSWYDDYLFIANTSRSWFLHSGRSASDKAAGVFHTNSDAGESGGYYSWRAVLLVGDGI